jgi:hypothetical protein
MGKARKNQRGIVYLIRCRFGSSHWHKIGFTTNLGNRLADLDRKLDFEFVDAIITGDAFGLEKYLHGQFKAKRKDSWQTSEVFDLDDADVECIVGLKDFEGAPIEHYANWIEASVQFR